MNWSINKKRVGLILLVVLSCIIYGAQLIIFRDPKNTGFYILQDFAFLPISIAIATIIVGDYLSSKERRERAQKTQMIRSAFFSELGSALLQEMVTASGKKHAIREFFEESPIQDRKGLETVQKLIRETEMELQLDRDCYDRINDLIMNNRDNLLIIASNPVILDHEDFTDLIWGIFHLVDERRFRGSFENLSRADLAHLEKDCGEIYQLLLLNWAENILYTKEMYPNYFSARLTRLREGD